MKKLTFTVTVPWWVVHVAWLAAIFTLVVVVLLKSGADISVTIDGTQQERTQQR